MNFPELDQAGLDKMAAEMKLVARQHPVCDYDNFVKDITKDQEGIAVNRFGEGKEQVIQTIGPKLPSVIEPFTRTFSFDMYKLQVSFVEFHFPDRRVRQLNVINTFFCLPLSDAVIAEIVSRFMDLSPSQVVDTPPHVLFMFQEIT